VLFVLDSTRIHPVDSWQRLKQSLCSCGCCCANDRVAASARLLRAMHAFLHSPPTFARTVAGPSPNTHLHRLR
jgi:hypothetical protein